MSASQTAYVHLRATEGAGVYPSSSSGISKETTVLPVSGASMVLRKKPALLCHATTVCLPLGTLRKLYRPLQSALVLQRFGVTTMDAAIFVCSRQFTNTIPGFENVTVRVWPV